jgi:cytoskeleton protein RodZ
MPDNLPQDFGAHLRQAREAHGTTLKEIAAATKISVHALEALERNDISRLPGGIFTRAFVRGYAREVGLDPERTLAAFLARFPDESVPGGDEGRPDAGARHQPGDRPARGPLNVAGLLVSVGLLVVFFVVFGRLFSRPSPSSSGAKSAAREVSGASRKPGTDKSATLPAAGQPAAGAAIGQPAPPPAMPQTSPAAAPAQPPAAGASAPQAAPASSVVATPTPARPDGTGGTPGESTVLSGTAGAAVTELGEAANARLRMEISATGPCWISATLDGGRTLARLMAPGERAILRAADAIVIRVGDAGSFRYTLNGEPGRPLGGPGQAVTERIDTSNFQGYQVR